MRSINSLGKTLRVKSIYPGDGSSTSVSPVGKMLSLGTSRPHAKAVGHNASPGKPNRNAKTKIQPYQTYMR